MPQDAFHIRRSCQELNALLIGGKINRISQVDKDELTFIVYTGKTTVKLIVSANASNARVCLSLTEKEPAAVAPNFCMLLRKHLQGAEILSVSQREFERIVEIRLRCTTDFSDCERVLHCEIMGKYSNVILTEKGVILGALKTSSLTDETHRVLFAGAKYLYPAPQNKLSHLDGAGLRSRLENAEKNRETEWETEELSAFLFENVSGLAMPTAREIVSRFEKQNGSLNNLLFHGVKTPLWEFVANFCEREPCRPHAQIKNGVICDFFAFEIENGIETPSLCKAEDEFYTARESKKGFENKKRKLESAVKTLLKKSAKRIQDVSTRLLDAEKAEENRLKGELLTANLYRVERGASSVELENWYDEKGGIIKIALDSALSPSQNAQRYFKIYNKQKRAKEILTPMLKDAQAELSYAESILAAIFSAESELDFKEIETELVEAGLLRAPKARAGGKKKEQPLPFREYEHNGFKILLGRNNLQNDRLLKFADAEDVWLHTQKYHSSHAIILVEGRQVCDETLLFAAELCAYFSDGRAGDKIPVDYCRRKFVKKPKASKAGFVTYTDYKTLLVTPNPHR